MPSPNKLRLILILSVVVGLANAQNQTDVGPTKDNTLFEDITGSLSNGIGPNFFAGKNNQDLIRRGVLAFDVAGNLPAGATIDSVTLTLYMDQTSAGIQLVELRRILADWGEGTSNSTGGMGAPATPGDATWLHTFYDTSFWTSPGGDFSMIVSASDSVDQVGSYTWGSTSQMIADVQDWLDNPTSNFGWLVLGNESDQQTSKRFGTRENTTPGNQPVLSVHWTGPSSVSGHAEIPEGFDLRQNFPNPFNPSTTIEYVLKENRRVRLSVYDMLGQEVTTLVNESQSAGLKKVIWDGTDHAGSSVSTGLYVYRISTGDFVMSRKMLYVK